jgi:hypothetical protein
VQEPTTTRSTPRILPSGATGYYSARTHDLTSEQRQTTGYVEPSRGYVDPIRIEEWAG